MILIVFIFEQCNALYSNLSLYLLNYAETYNKFASPIYASLRPVKTAFFQEMVRVANRWQLCLRYDRLEIWFSDLPLQRRTRYRTTNWL